MSSLNMNQIAPLPLAGSLALQNNSENIIICKANEVLVSGDLATFDVGDSNNPLIKKGAAGNVIGVVMNDLFKEQIEIGQEVRVALSGCIVWLTATAAVVRGVVDAGIAIDEAAVGEMYRCIVQTKLGGV